MIQVLRTQIIRTLSQAQDFVLRAAGMALLPIHANRPAPASSETPLRADIPNLEKFEETNLKRVSIGVGGGEP